MADKPANWVKINYGSWQTQKSIFTMLTKLASQTTLNVVAVVVFKKAKQAQAIFFPHSV